MVRETPKTPGGWGSLKSKVLGIYFELVLTSIFLGLAASLMGAVIVMTPSLTSAEMWSLSTARGSVVV